MASLTGLIALMVAAFYGGWEWVLLSFVVLVTLWHSECGVIPILATLGVGYFWLALFHWSGDRRIFFLYAMHLAVQMPYLLQGRVWHPAIVGGGGIIAVFMLIRITQSPTAGVLIVELITAATILALVLSVCSPSARGSGTRVIAGVLGSALAFVGLAI